MGADELSATLWRERKRLELLLFRLESQLFHVRAGNWRWLNFTASDVENVLENLRFDTLARNIESSAVAIQWGAPANATLPTIASVAPPGIWPELLQEHHHAMVLLLNQVGATAAANVEALQLGSRAPGTTADPDAAADPDGAADVMLLAVTANIQRALAVTKDCSLPLLEEFLKPG